MLNAVFAGKKRGTGLQSQRVALGFAEGAEDVLTATIFERLAYLPDELFDAVMSDLLGQPFGALQEVEYWPSWHLENCTRVEPDVVLRGDNCQVLIEAKRYDHVRQQSTEQLANELLAGWHGEHLDDQCILLTLGGLEDLSDAARQQLRNDILQLLPDGSETRFELVCRSWQQLYQTLERHIRPDSPLGCQRLIEDISKCYAWHGLRTHPMRWLAELQPMKIEYFSNAFTAWSMK